MSSHNRLTLAIESAIAGGSLALLRNGEVLAGWSGSASVSKSDELLANIDDLLKANHITPTDLELIAVSAGPGSFTGIRIGIATALGLKTGLGIEMSSVSALKAMAFVQADHQRLITVVPVGRDAVCLQGFSSSNGDVTEFDQARTIKQDELPAKDLSGAALIVHGSLFDYLDANHAVNFGTDIASAIGQYAVAKPVTITAPLFVSKSF